GVVLDPSATDAFVEAVARMANDKDLRARYADVARAAPKIDVNSRIAELGAVYDEIARTR
ncbi:MAG: hypothetical protein WD826_08790, partial [Actinomycetota bacterium]